MRHKPVQSGGSSLARTIGAILVALVLCALESWSANSVASADSPLALGGVSLGTSIEAAVQTLGAPGLVQTTDDGHEWRWYDARGLDVDMLTDDTLTIRQILVARPEPIGGKPAALVQPKEFPVLEMPANQAALAMRNVHATRQQEPEGTVSAWRLGENLVVLELRDDAVRKILALDRESAARIGYLGAPPPSPSFRSPRLIRQFPVDYPKRAIQQRAQGVVVVRVDISKTGSVEDVHVIVSSGNADIDAAEVTSLRKSTFRPARCGDQPCDGVFLDREEYTLDT